MISQYVEGYTSKATFCPFCGEQIYTFNGNGSCLCENTECNKRFYVIEGDEEE